MALSFFVTSFNWRRRKLSEMHLNWIQLLPVISGIDWPFYQRNPVLKPLKPVSKFKYWSVIQSNFSTEIIYKQCNFIHIMQKKGNFSQLVNDLNSEYRIELSNASGVCRCWRGFSTFVTCFIDSAPAPDTLLLVLHAGNSCFYPLYRLQYFRNKD